MAKKIKTTNNLSTGSKDKKTEIIVEETVQKNEKTLVEKEENVLQEDTNHVFSEEECETILNEKIETDIPLIDVVEFEKDINIEDIKLEQPQKKQNKPKTSFEQMFGYFWNGQM